MEHTKTRTTCDDCNPLWDRKLNVKSIQLCPLHAAAPELLKALEVAAERFRAIAEGVGGDCMESDWADELDTVIKKAHQP